MSCLLSVIWNSSLFYSLPFIVVPRNIKIFCKTKVNWAKYYKENQEGLGRVGGLAFCLMSSCTFTYGSYRFLQEATIKPASILGSQNLSLGTGKI